MQRKHSSYKCIKLPYNSYESFYSRKLHKSIKYMYLVTHHINLAFAIFKCKIVCRKVVEIKVVSITSFNDLSHR